MEILLSYHQWVVAPNKNSNNHDNDETKEIVVIIMSSIQLIFTNKFNSL